MKTKANFIKNGGRFSLIYAIAFFRQQMLLLPVLLLFYLENGLTVGDYFLFQGVMTLLTVLLEMPAGYAADKLSPKIVLIFAFLMLFSRDVFWLFGHGYWIVLTGEFCYTLFRVCFDSIASSYMYTALKKQNRAENINRVYSIFNGVMCLSTAAAALYGSYIFKAAGYKVVLAVELLFILAAVVSACLLPSVQREKQEVSVHKNRFGQLVKISKYVFKQKSLIPFIAFSGLLVAFSNFFFWSFQPLLKLSDSPVMLFGFVVLINNIIRFSGSLFAGKLNEIFGLKMIASKVFWLEVSSLVLVGTAYFVSSSWLCMLLIFFLCLCIGGQLVFTINHISRLHKIVLSPIRSSMSSFNMVAARLMTAVLMISAKFLLPYFGIIAIMAGYVGLILLPVGWFFLRRIVRQI